MYGRHNKPFTKGVKVVHRRKTANADAKMKKNDKKTNNCGQNIIQKDKDSAPPTSL